MISANKARGEVALRVGGKDFRLCLTLGALARIEEILCAQSFAHLAARLRTLSAIEMAAVLRALFVDPEEARALDDTALSPLDAARAIAHAFEVGFAE